MPSYYEFFAGGGMVRAGLGPGWRCLLANDIDAKKAAAYAANWGSQEFVCRDVAALGPADLPSRADLAWASFPCQDLSLAGAGEGLGRPGSNRRTRSGTFWPFWSLIEALAGEGRAPPVVALENVAGILTSHGGRDFIALCRALAGAGYRFGALVIDARRFVPQSRPRVFVIAVREDLAVPAALAAQARPALWSSPALRAAHARLGAALQRRWIWWSLPAPAGIPSRLESLVEDALSGVAWDAPSGTARILGSMTAVNLAKVEAARASGARRVGTLYRRTRPDGQGGRTPRWEVRFDDVAGCLRTPAGGSSRQKLLIVEGEEVRSRLITAREAARLMGLPDSYRLPEGYGDAYHVTGDGVVAPVVRHLAEMLLEPLVRAAADGTRAAA